MHFLIYTKRRRIELLESEIHRHYHVAGGGDEWHTEDIWKSIKKGGTIKFDPPVGNANIREKPHLYFDVNTQAESELFNTEDYEGEDTDATLIMITPPDTILLSIRKLIT